MIENSGLLNYISKLIELTQDEKIKKAVGWYIPGNKQRYHSIIGSQRVGIQLFAFYETYLVKFCETDFYD